MAKDKKEKDRSADQNTIRRAQKQKQKANAKANATRKQVQQSFDMEAASKEARTREFRRAEIARHEADLQNAIKILIEGLKTNGAIKINLADDKERLFCAPLKSFVIQNKTEFHWSQEGDILTFKGNKHVVK